MVRCLYMLRWCKIIANIIFDLTAISFLRSLIDMLMVRVFYVEKKQTCCSQNRAELLLACVIVNQDVWCFCLQCAMSFSSLFLPLVVLIGYLCPLMGLLYVNNHLLISLSITENVIKAYLHRAWDRIKEFRRVSVYNLVSCPWPVQKWGLGMKLCITALFLLHIINLFCVFC